MPNNEFKIYLQTIIDDSSLNKAEKELAKKKLEIQADINFKNFAKNKADIEKQFQALSGIIKNILGDAVTDKQATQWAKQYYKEIESGAKEAVKEQEKLNTAQKKNTLAEQEGYYKRIIENTKQIYSLKNKLLTADSEQTVEINKQLKALEERNKYNYSQLDKKGLSDDNLERQVSNSRVALENQLKLNQAKQIDIANSKTLSSINDKHIEIQLGIDTEKYTTQIFNFQQQLSKFGIESGETFLKASASLKQLEAAYNDMKFSDGNKRLDYEKEYQKLLETTKNLMTQIKGQKSNELISNGDNRRISLINELNNYLQKNTAMTKQSKQAVTDWINTLASADDITMGTFDNIKAEYKGLDAQLRQNGQLGLSWTDKYKQAVAKFGGWGIATGSVMELWNQLRKIPKEVYDVDTAMTNLYKVTDVTDSKYSKFLDNASTKAQNLGRSISGLVDQTADWAKLGYDIDQASKLAETSSIYANVGEVDDKTAVSDLVTAIKAFNIEASDSITIVDSLNKLGNEFATDSASLGEGLKKSASALNLAGNDINQTLAMITGGTEITQNASEMGNALKVLSMRLTIQPPYYENNMLCAS